MSPPEVKELTRGERVCHLTGPEIYDLRNQLSLCDSEAWLGGLRFLNLGGGDSLWQEAIEGMADVLADSQEDHLATLTSLALGSAHEDKGEIGSSRFFDTPEGFSADGISAEVIGATDPLVFEPAQGVSPQVSGWASNFQEMLIFRVCVEIQDATLQCEGNYFRASYLTGVLLSLPNEFISVVKEHGDGLVVVSYELATSETSPESRVDLGIRKLQLTQRNPRPVLALHDIAPKERRSALDKTKAVFVICVP